MGGNEFIGIVEARIVELRFSSSGKLINLLKRRGDLVKKSELIASLDRKLLQMELDKQLGDFEKVRAEFEIFNLQKGEPADDITKYLKTAKQAELNNSVKEVELAKAKLDQADLFSPVDGIIIDDSNLVSGIYITPSSNPIMIIDTSSYFFTFQIEQMDLEKFSSPKAMTVDLDGLSKKYSGTTKLVYSSENGKLNVEVKLDDVSGLLLGLKGKAIF